MTGYDEDPAGYWLWRGATYADEEAYIRGPESVTTLQGRYLSEMITIASDTLVNPVIVELGCAYGRLLHELRQRIPAAHLTGVDFSKSQLDRAQLYLENDVVHLIHAVGHSMPLKTKSADVVYTHGCLMHIPGTRIIDVVKEITRVAVAVIHVEESVSSSDGYITNHDLTVMYWALGWSKRLDVNYPHNLRGQKLRCQVFYDH